MDKYVVKLYTHAYRDLDDIYTYIAKTLLEPGTALNIIDELEEAIFSPKQLPERGAIRRIGAYKDGNYRQLFIKNYCIIYRLMKKRKRCISLQYGIRRAISKSGLIHISQGGFKS